MSEIKIINAKKIYNDVPVIENLNVTIPKGSLFTLLGPSGCGKTTLLRMIAGFNSIEGGEFYFDDTKINNMEPSKRNIGMVFQNYAIFPHLTVRDNVAFGLKQKKVPKEELIKQTNKYLELMQIAQYADRKPDKLSGGQQQRVALARALAVNPSVLLMDEPLSNLDAKLRLDMRQAIREIQHEVGITTVYVTHDQEEAMAVSDRIAVMKDGEIQHLGQPKDIYQRPANVFVATFIGKTNILEGKLTGSNLKINSNYEIPMDNIKDKNVQGSVLVSIRPEEFLINDVNDTNGIKAIVDSSVFLGLNTHYFVHLEDGEKLEVVQESKIDGIIPKGTEIYLTVKKDKINVFTDDGSKNILTGVNNDAMGVANGK